MSGSHGTIRDESGFVFAQPLNNWNVSKVRIWWHKGPLKDVTPYFVERRLKKPSTSQHRGLT